MFFLIFWVDKSVALAPTYPQVRWGTQTYIVLLKARKLCVELILNFWKVHFNQQE